MAWLEILSSQGTKPLEAKVTGPVPQRVYDKVCKSNVFCLETSKITIPKNEKKDLAIVQHFLVFQLQIMPGSFTIEIGITDISNAKRRLLFTSNSKELVLNPLHARIPNLAFKKGVWMNLTFDIVNWINFCFPGNTFRSVDNITISAPCKLRKIFSMRNSPADTTEESEILQLKESEQVPRSLDFPPGVTQVTQVFSPAILQNYFAKEELNQPNVSVSRKNTVQIAFGKRIIPKTTEIQHSQQEANSVLLTSQLSQPKTSQVKIAKKQVRAPRTASPQTQTLLQNQNPYTSPILKGSSQLTKVSNKENDQINPTKNNQSIQKEKESLDFQKQQPNNNFQSFPSNEEDFTSLMASVNLSQVQKSRYKIEQTQEEQNLIQLEQFIEQQDNQDITDKNNTKYGGMLFNYNIEEIPEELDYESVHQSIAIKPESPLVKQQSEGSPKEQDQSSQDNQRSKLYVFSPLKESNNNPLKDYNIQERLENLDEPNQEHRPFSPPFFDVNNGKEVKQSIKLEDSLNLYDSLQEEAPDNPPVFQEVENANLVFDPVLNCYYDPDTQQYYQFSSNS